MALRREICERFIREPGYRFVELPDPQRARAATAIYRQAVADWHAARAAGRGPTRSNPSWDPTVSARSWRGATRRCTTARCASSTSSPPRVDIDYDVIPGITAIQALTARHRIPLNDIGEPVLITTGRQLRDPGCRGSAVVMLDGDCSFRSCPPDTRIWWGAYLGTPDELLVAGTVGEVGERIAAAAGRGPRPARLDHGHLPACDPP